MLRHARTALAVASSPLAPPRRADRTFPNATPGRAGDVAADASTCGPSGPGPFPAVVLHARLRTACRRARSAGRAGSRDRGYVALVVDSFGAARHHGRLRARAPDDRRITARFDDAVGALRWLQAPPVRRARDRVGAIGWSNGGVFAMSVVNGPSLERARARGVTMPAPGFAAGGRRVPGRLLLAGEGARGAAAAAAHRRRRRLDAAARVRGDGRGHARPRRRRDHRALSGRRTTTSTCEGQPRDGADGGRERQQAGRLLRRHRRRTSAEAAADARRRIEALLRPASAG